MDEEFFQTRVRMNDLNQYQKVSSNKSDPPEEGRENLFKSRNSSKKNGPLVIDRIFSATKHPSSVIEEFTVGYHTLNTLRSDKQPTM